MPQTRAEFLPIAACVGLSALVACAGLAGCASKQKADGPAKSEQPVADTTKSPFPVSYEDWSRAGYRLDWVGFPFGAPKRDNKVTYVRPAGEVVLLMDETSRVSVLETSNGARRWSVDVAGPLTKFVDLRRSETDADRVIVSSDAEAFVLSLSNSAILQRDKFDRVVSTAPVVFGSIAIYGAANGEIMAHGVGLSARAWGFSTGGAIEVNPVKLESTVCVVSRDQNAYFMTPEGRLVGRGSMYGRMVTNPVALGDRVFLASTDQSLWCFDQFGGFVWRQRTPVPLTVQPTAWEGVVYCEIPGSGLSAFDAASGTLKWTAKDVKGTVVAERSGNLLAWDGKDLCALDPRNGDVLWRMATPGVVSITPESFKDGALYLVNNRSLVARMRPST